MEAKLSYLATFGLEFERNKHLWIWENAKVHVKQTKKTKTVLSEYCLTEIWKKPIVAFDISTIEFVKMPTVLLKILNIGPKLAYLAIFGLELENKLFSIIEINTPEFFKIQNFI